MRLFLAIFPPEEFRAYFRDCVRQLDKEKRNIRTINLEQVHLTVRFIGSKVGNASKEALVEEFKRHAHTFAKPEIALKGVQFGFPRQYDPRIIHGAITDNHEIHELINQSHKLIRGLYLDDTIRWKEADDHNYHMTFARLKPNAARAVGKRLKPLIESIDLPLPQPFIAHEMWLMESIIPRDKPPIYRKLERIEL